MGNPSTPRFEALDGLRAWAAWTVVIVHIAWQSELYKINRFWGLVNQCGLWSVLLFTVISGFSITNLVLTKNERYSVYICRRFFRLFPAYFLALILGLAAYAIAQRYSGTRWFEAVHADTYHAFLREPALNLIAHLAMLHGIIPNNLLDLSSVVILPPGWSISLEWQFYLIAPAIISLSKSLKGLLAVAGTAILLAIVYRQFLVPYYAQPSMIMQFGFVFVIGIATRIVLMPSKDRRYAIWLSVACLVAAVLTRQPWLAVWGFVALYISNENRSSNSAQAFVFVLLDRALSSRMAVYLGERSYSTYVLHWPILLLLGTIATGHYNLGGFELASVLLFTVPLTALVQEFVYSAVERPSKTVAFWVIRHLDRKRIDTVLDDPVCEKGIVSVPTR